MIGKLAELNPAVRIYHRWASLGRRIAGSCLYENGHLIVQKQSAVKGDDEKGISDIDIPDSEETSYEKSIDKSAKN